jgi:hypothetical protein
MYSAEGNAESGGGAAGEAAVLRWTEAPPTAEMTPMLSRRSIVSRAIAMAFAFSFVATSSVIAAPQPSPYPISWELKFEPGKPKRILVVPAGGNKAEAFWYLSFSVTNLGSQEQRFLPVFELMTEDGNVVRSDNKIPVNVFEEIKRVEQNEELESMTQIAGTVNVGEENVRQGVAIWREPTPEMGHFSIFVSGLSGESIILKDDKGSPVMKEVDGRKLPVVMRKTRKLDYHVPGDARLRGNEPANFVEASWVMR